MDAKLWISNILIALLLIIIAPNGHILANIAIVSQLSLAIDLSSKGLPGQLRKMFTKRLRVTFLALGAVLLLSACASSHMRDVPEPVAVTKPTDNTATLVLMRPSMFGGAIQSSVYDITTGQSEFVGIVSAGKKLAYEAP